MAKELAALPVDVSVAVPVAIKLVDSLALPGGNITGISHITVELSAKRMEMLKESISNLSRVALLVNPNDRLMTLAL